MKMRNKLAPNLALVLLTVVLVSIIILAVPDKALEILPVVIVSTAFVVLVLWRSNIDAKKDERSMQLMGYGARNAFIFLLFAMPWLAAYHVLGIIVLDAAIAICILWILSLGIAWLTFLYYFTR